MLTLSPSNSRGHCFSPLSVPPHTADLCSLKSLPSALVPVVSVLLLSVSAMTRVGLFPPLQSQPTTRVPVGGSGGGPPEGARGSCPPPPTPQGHGPLPRRDSTLRLSEPVSQESAPFLGQIKDIQSRLNCLDFCICFWFFTPHFLLQSN